MSLSWHTNTQTSVFSNTLPNSYDEQGMSLPDNTTHMTLMTVPDKDYHPSHDDPSSWDHPPFDQTSAYSPAMPDLALHSHADALPPLYSPYPHERTHCCWRTIRRPFDVGSFHSPSDPGTPHPLDLRMQSLQNDAHSLTPHTSQSD